MKTRISFFVLTTALLLFGNVGQASEPWSWAGSVRTNLDSGRTRFAAGLSVRFDPETGVDQIYYSPIPRGRLLRLTDTAIDKSEPVWGPEGVTYSFYDRAENVILTCAEGDLFYDLAGVPPFLEMGCVAGRDSAAPVVISGYPLNAFAGASAFAIADYHVALGEGVSYEVGGVVHAAYPVVVKTSEGTDVLVLHDDEAHLGETDYEDGFVSYYDVVVADDASGNVVTGIPDDAWDGTVTCEECIPDRASDEDGFSGENEAGNGDEGLNEDSDESVPDSEAEDVAVSISSEEDPDAEEVVTGWEEDDSGDQTITIHNEIVVTSSAASGDVNVSQEQNQTDDGTSGSGVEPSVTPDVSAETPEPSGGYAMLGDSIGNCGLNASNPRHESALEGLIAVACFSLLVLTRFSWRSLCRVRGTTVGALTVVLVVQQAMSPAWALQAAVVPEKIAVVPAGRDASELMPLTHELRRRLHGLNVLPIKAALQNLSLGGEAAPETRQALLRLDAIWDDYDAYRKGEAETRGEFAEALAEMRSRLPLSVESSRLLTSASLTLAWFDLKLGNRAVAVRELEGILNLSPETAALDAYPGSFRSFVKKFLSRGREPISSGLALSSSPEAVNAYIDGVFVGVTPLRVALKSGRYRVGFEATGRSPLVREIVVEGGETRTIRGRLPWLKKGKRGSANRSVAEWDDSGTAGKLAISEGIARLAQADVAVAVSVKKTRSGFVPTLTAYDARSGRMTDEIAYSKPLAGISESTETVAGELADKLAAVLRSRRFVSGKRGMNREVAVDPAERRGTAAPLYKKTAFWAALGGIAAAGVIAGVLASQGDSSGSRTGGLVVGF
jgi:hypothetical protein